MLSHKILTTIDYLQWQPIKISKEGPTLSHLFFADDIILFSKVTTKSCHAIVDVLNQLMHHSGQQINFDKSKIYFSKNCKPTDKQFVTDSFSIKEGTSFGKYLGFPMFQGK